LILWCDDEWWVVYYEVEVVDVFVYGVE